MLNQEDVLARVRAFVIENFAYMRPDLELANDASLIATGIVDSMGVMEVIEFLETEFGVVVSDGHITEANIGTLDAIAGYVVARQPATATRQTA